MLETINHAFKRRPAKSTTPALATILLILTVGIAVSHVPQSVQERNLQAPPGHLISPLTSTGDFSISSTADDLSVAAGSSTTTRIVLNSLNGFSGTVNLSASSTPSGLTLSTSPSSDAVTAGCSCSSIFTVSTIQTTPVGLYNVPVTGTSESTSHTTLLQVAVTPITWTINDNENFTGVNVRTTGSLYVDSPSNVFTTSGTITVTATNATTHASLFSKTYTISKQALYSPYQHGYKAYFILNIAVSPYALGVHLEPALGGPTSTTPGAASMYLFVYRNADVNGDGFVTYTDYYTAVASFGCSVGQPCYNGAADLNGSGQVDIIDIAVIAVFVGAINYGVASYGITSNSNSLSVQAGGSSTATITLASLNNFAGTIGLVATVSPSGPSANLNPASLTLTAGGSTASTLTITASSPTPTGFYTVNVNATSGTKTFTISLSLDVVDFTLSANPSDFTVHNGKSATSTISVLPLNGFTGTVSLTASVTPSTTGPTVSISPASVSVSSCGGTSTLNFNAQGTNGLYNVTVTGTSGSVSHSITVQVATAPLSFTINDNENFTGVNVKTTGNLSIDSPATAIIASGSVSVVATNASTGASLFSKTYTISHLAFNYPNSGGYQALFLVNVGVSPYALATYFILQLAGPTSTAPGAASVLTPFVARNADLNANGTVDQSDFNTISADFGCNIGQSCYNPKADLNADGTVNITDVAICGRYFGAPNYI